MKSFVYAIMILFLVAPVLDAAAVRYRRVTRTRQSVKRVSVQRPVAVGTCKIVNGVRVCR